MCEAVRGECPFREEREQFERIDGQTQAIDTLWRSMQLHLRVQLNKEVQPHESCRSAVPPRVVTPATRALSPPNPQRYTRNAAPLTLNASPRTPNPQISTPRPETLTPELHLLLP